MFARWNNPLASFSSSYGRKRSVAPPSDEILQITSLCGSVDFTEGSGESSSQALHISYGNQDRILFKQEAFADLGIGNHLCRIVGGPTPIRMPPTVLQGSRIRCLTGFWTDF